MKKVAFVVPLGLEPRLFWTKTRRVASYTMGQFHNVLQKPNVWCRDGKFRNNILFHNTNSEKCAANFIRCDSSRKSHFFTFIRDLPRDIFLNSHR